MTKYAITLLALLLTGSSLAQKKDNGEVSLGVGYGPVTPWQADMKLNLGNQRFTFSPFVGIEGITHYSSEQRADENYTFTGRMPLSEHQGLQYLSHRETEGQGTEATYGFHLNWNAAACHTLQVNLKGGNTHHNQQGTLREELWQPNGTRSAQTLWKLNNPLLHENELNLNAQYAWRIDEGKKGVLLAKYNFLRSYEEEEKEMEGIELQGFADFTHSTLNADANLQHHTLDLNYNKSLGHDQVMGNVRYENRKINSHTQQWLNEKLTLDDPFHHRYQTLALAAGYRWLPVESLKLTANLEYAYTAMEDRKMHDILPTAVLEWKPCASTQLTLRYVRQVIRPSFELLDPAEVRGPFTLHQGNKDLKGMRPNRLALDLKWNKGIMHWGLNTMYIFVNDGFNAIWMERGGQRIYQWGNEGQRRAWGITPNLNLQASRTTQVNASVNVLWDKRVAEAILLSNSNWGVQAHLDLQQTLPQAFLLKVYGDYSEGNTLDLYRHEGHAYTLGAHLTKAFGTRIQASLLYQYQQYTKDVITQGAYTGTSWLRPAQHNQISLKLSCKL